MVWCEAQKVERFRLVLAALLPVVGGMTTSMAPESNQARFIRVECQPERAPAVSPVLEKLLGVCAMLEAQHNIAGVADDHREVSSEMNMLPRGTCSSACRLDFDL
jgi:hypothetical protein